MKTMSWQKKDESAVKCVLDDFTIHFLAFLHLQFNFPSIFLLEHSLFSENCFACFNLQNATLKLLRSSLFSIFISLANPTRSVREDNISGGNTQFSIAYETCQVLWRGSIYWWPCLSLRHSCIWFRHNCSGGPSYLFWVYAWYRPSWEIQAASSRTFGFEFPK